MTDAGTITITARTLDLARALLDARAERDEWKRLAVAGELIARKLRLVEAERDRLAAELDATRKVKP